MKNSLPTGASLPRRTFLAMSAAIPAALAAQISSGGEAPEPAVAGSPAVKRPRVGLELYSVRDELARNLAGTLATVSGLGYEVVEFYSPYFEWTPAYAKDVRAQMDDLGLRCCSTHNGFVSFSSDANLAHAIELNQILGTRYLILASAPASAQGLEGWKRLCEQLTAVAGKLQPHGLGTGYHNHQAEWAKLEDGKRIIEVIAENTPREFVLQLDVGTCEEAGADPVAWVKANPGRMKVMHLKDWAPGPAKEEKGYRVLFGEGVTPWKELIAVAESVGGAEYLLIEQEGSRYSEFETARRCMANWRALSSQA
jgi:sugar phosphate isomerase/epimerase